ncbi:MAG: hypothetical protein AM326_04675 [Candidatus Thorarchaeota archaeon SMTZ-45]|nr:MAG: hypothetical protein AM326_04675 [Candidatus Thorarchaeota archaeon SMTZ-45]
MVGSEKINSSLTLRREVLVLVISAIVISSVIIVDISLAGHEYKVSEPTFTHRFPETIYFYNISEGVNFNEFSFIVELPVNHSGDHHLIPREISLLFWFRDNDSGVDLSTFIYAIQDGPRNSTFSFYLHDFDMVNKYENGWWSPTLLTFILNENPDVDSVSFGLYLELLLANINGDDFDGHELNAQLEMNVTYSRWWFGLPVNRVHQTISFVFNLPDDGVADVQSLEY